MFTSFLFIIFLTITWLIYLAVPGKFREIVLLLAGYIFCGYISLIALLVLLATTLLVYGSAMVIDIQQKNGKKAGGMTALSILAFAFVLIVVKNIPWGINILGGFGLAKNHILRKLILPVGFSFYAFQAVGYIYDVYSKKETAEKNIIRFALYMGFFPKFVSGPIERKGTFCRQLENLKEVKIFNDKRINQALMYMLWGYLLKMVVADRLAIMVDTVHRMPQAYDSMWLVLCAVFYSFQVYADFAGYTCIAIGCAKMFGIELISNFESPYMSASITEFWRRWHISLSTWLRDYVYIPLGGNRLGVVRKYINTMIVFILCGIWHGNGLSFLVWGMLHGVYSIIDSYTLKKCNVILARILTFMAVSFAWILFRADTLTVAVKYIVSMFTNGINLMGSVRFYQGEGANIIQVCLGIIFIVLLQFLDRISYKKKVAVPMLMAESKSVIKCVYIYLIIMIIFVFGIYGGNFDADKFIYMQF